ncbi:unnamed protein product [Phytomonas sp. EM1]|nr:unnamed protein product [Phytomonas sp. EM1]|eukprot:CCW62007.1 unnamed protein product [Phytomonas sp. isolate EM1]
MKICIEKLDGADNATLALIMDYITAYPDMPFDVAYELAGLKRKNLTATAEIGHYSNSEQKNMGAVATGAEESKELEALKHGWKAFVASGSTNDALKDIISQTKAFQANHIETRASPKRSSHRQEKKLLAMLDVLHPLLGSLHNRSFTAEDGLWLAYLELLPGLLEGVFYDYALNMVEREHADRLSYEQLWRASEVWEDAREIVAPFLWGFIEPLEKELVFHFHSGLETAQRSEPQHFFTFLLDLLHRLDKSGAISTASSSEGRSRINLLDFGQLRLALTAVVILSETYQWNPAIASFLSDASSAYIVHFINSFFDFVEQAKGSVYSQTLEFLSAYVLADRAMRVYTDSCNLIVERAFKRGAAALWRRTFLSSGIEALPFYLNTVHFVRCADAITRRLCSTVLHVDPVRGGKIVREFVESSIGTCVAFTEEHVSPWFEGVTDDDVNWDHVLRIQEVVLSLCSVMTAAEVWLDMLKDGATKGPQEPLVSCSANAPFETLGELAAHRNQLIRMSTVVSGQLVKLMCRSSEAVQPSIGDYEDLERLLGYLHHIPDGFSLLALEAAIKEQFEESLTIEKRESLQHYLSASGLWRTSCLIG